MNPKNRSLRPKPLACAALALFFVPLAGVSAPQASAIDYDNVDDILNGQHSLLQIDDLLVLRQFGQNIAELEYKTSNGSPIRSGGATFPLPSVVTSPVATANMFRTGGPVLVFAGGDVNLMPTLTLRSADPTKMLTFTTPLPNGTRLTATSNLTVADFTGDGLDDIVVDTDKGVQVCTARDPNVFNLELRCGPLLSIPTRLRAVTSGDFNGDGKQRLAFVGQYVGGVHISLWILNVNPQTLAISTASYMEKQVASMRFFAIAAGRFTLVGKPQHDQLAYAYQADTGTTKIVTVDFANSSLKQEVRNTWDSGYVTGRGVVGGVILKRAHLDWFSPYDELVFLVSQFERQQTLAILAITPDTLAVRKASTLSLPAVGLGSSVVGGVAIGNFDRNTQTPNGQTQHDPNLQIALSAVNLENSFRAVDFSVSVINVGPGSDFKLSVSVGPKISSVLPPNQTVTSAVSVLAADLQGRSINLGPPTKIVINNQGGPSLVAAVPPMHVDYIAPSGSATPTLLNLSAIEKGFSTSYKMESSSEAQTTTKSTDSYSWGLEESIEGKLTIGNPKANHISGGFNFAAQQTFEDGVEKNYTSSGSSTFDASFQTGTSDHLWYDQSRLNIYSYPVLGKMVCPSEKPENCAAAEQVPLTIQFSAIDRSTSASVAGNQIEWYQPVWEYGNVLSYPASYSQLRLLYPDIEQLGDGRAFFTDPSTSSATATWLNRTSGSESVSSARRFGEGGGLSVSGALEVPILPVGGISGAFEFNVSGSQAFERLNTSVTELGNSFGITVDKPGNFREPRRYAYSVTPFIFGLIPRPDTVDKPKLEGDIQTAGPVQAAFVVDPLLSGSGSWWEAAYSKAPDVALNHPARWVFTQSDASTPNCVGGTCISLAAGDANDPWDSDFHAMRGFFISDAASPGQGPQLSTAFAGDKLELETRVYNYSFVKMPADSTVHVRFYAQRMEKNKPIGASSLIGETKLGPIPPFSDQNNAPLNSVRARTTFDTSNYADQKVAFWVVTWIEDKNGALVKEPEGHGLLGIPGALTSLADVKAEQYSNNVGFYKWQIYVRPRPRSTAANVSQQSSRLAVAAQTGTISSPAAMSGAAPNSSSIAALQMMQLTNLDVSSGQKAALGEEVTVSIGLQAGSDPIPGATVLFYDGDPKNGGQIFDMEHVPYVRANETQLVEVNFRAQTCGSHDLYAVTYQGTEYEKVSEPFVLQIDCSK